MLVEPSLLTRPALMLREKPEQRPNIYQVVREVAAMRGTDVPIKDVSSFTLQFPWGV